MSQADNKWKQKKRLLPASRIDPVTGRRHNNQVAGIAKVWSETALLGGMFFVTVDVRNYNRGIAQVLTANTVKGLFPDAIYVFASECKQSHTHTHMIIVTRILHTTTFVLDAIKRCVWSWAPQATPRITVNFIYRGMGDAFEYINEQQVSCTVYNQGYMYPEGMPPWGNPYCEINHGSMFADWKGYYSYKWIETGAPRYLIRQTIASSDTAPRGSQYINLRRKCLAARRNWIASSKHIERMCTQYTEKVGVFVYNSASQVYEAFAKATELTVKFQGSSISRECFVDSSQTDSVIDVYLDEPVVLIHFGNDKNAQYVQNTVSPLFNRSDVYLNVQAVIVITTPDVQNQLNAQ